MADRLQYQLDALERLLVVDDLTDRVFKGHGGQARQFAGLLAMHLNRGPETQGAS